MKNGTENPFKVLEGGAEGEQKLPDAMLTLDGKMYVGQGRRWVEEKTMDKETMKKTGVFQIREPVTDPALINKLREQWSKHLIIQEVPKKKEGEE